MFCSRTDAKFTMRTTACKARQGIRPKRRAVRLNIIVTDNLDSGELRIELGTIRGAQVSITSIALILETLPHTKSDLQNTLINKSLKVA